MAIAPKTSAERRTLETARLGELLRRAWRLVFAREVFLIGLVFFVVFTFLSLKSETFLTPQNIAGLLRNISWLAIVALGESLVIIIGGIDLSVGATMALAGLMASRSMQLGAAVPLAVAIGLSVGLVIGWVNGMLTAHIRLPAFVVTLATMSIARGFAYNLTRGWPVTNLPPSLSGSARPTSRSARGSCRRRSCSRCSWPCWSSSCSHARFWAATSTQ